ncbi:hypothetical protein HKX48_002019, partial [Thoreauomyces humboldtii]
GTARAVFRALACFRDRLTGNAGSLAPCCKLPDTPARYELQALKAVAARYAFNKREDRLSIKDFVLRNLEAVMAYDIATIFRVLASFRQVDRVPDPRRLADTPARFEFQALRAVAARHAFLRRQNTLSLSEFVSENVEAVRAYDQDTIFRALSSFRHVVKVRPLPS